MAVLVAVKAFDIVHHGVALLAAFAYLRRASLTFCWAVTESRSCWFLVLARVFARLDPRDAWLRVVVLLLYLEGTVLCCLQCSAILHKVIEAPLVLQRVLSDFIVPGSDDEAISDQGAGHVACRTRTLEVAVCRLSLDGYDKVVEAVTFSLSKLVKLIVG